jgi:glycosyltransferase involved in cell wall biosynthesis
LTERCGWWVEPTVEGIENALRTATALPTAALRVMGRRGRAWASREFAWKGIAQRMIAAYEDALSRVSTKGARATA